MLDLGNQGAQVCVVGRTSFSSGIGSVTFAACELFARSVPVCILPTDTTTSGTKTIDLPNGRPIPVCRNVDDIHLFFYADVLWNGAHDSNYALIPNHGRRIAHIAYDSDELPGRWVQILNQRFDLALFSSRHLEQVATFSGVRIPIGTLPIGLPLEGALARNLPFGQGRKVRFGSVAAWHERKDNLALLQAFLDEFGSDDRVELVLHSNLTIGDAHEAVVRELEASGATNVTVSHQQLSATAKDRLLDSIDILANCSRGEGYSIAPREALARGSMLVLSDIGAHQELFGVPGVFRVPATRRSPARYPEIDHQIFGHQTRVERADVARCLRQAFNYAAQENDTEATWARKRLAAQFSFSTLSADYAELVDPALPSFRRHVAHSEFAHVPAPSAACGQTMQHTGDLRCRNWIVVPAHDGGFFSVFNSYISHLTWDLDEERCHAVIPDWDVSRLLARMSPNRPTSFCYGTPDDGNVWCLLFEPPFGFSAEEMNDAELLHRKGVAPETVFNEGREPLLTYVYAYDLYRRPSFQNFRRQYNKTIRDHVRLLPRFQSEIDAFVDTFDEKYMFSAHVKHPSHVIEQPGGSLAATRAYLDRIGNEVVRRGLGKPSQDWGVFLATDQESVVVEFQERFGERVHVFPDVRRTSIDEDSAYHALPPSEQIREGHQIQHLVAQSPNDWSVRMAWEVVRDAMVMARCQVMFHVVSNVATAVSYLGPDVEMIFCEDPAPVTISA